MAVCIRSLGRVIIVLALGAANSLAAERAWWDGPCVFVQTPDAATARSAHANAAMTGAGDDPAWGTFSQRERIVAAQERTACFHAYGIKVLSYVEAFGEAASYVAQLKRDPQGDWQKSKKDPTLTEVFLNFWSWDKYDGAGEIHWIGLPDYFNAADAAAPWTRSHARYGCPMMTYPDGRSAVGQSDPQDPRTSAIYAAGCAKDVNGRLAFEYDYGLNVPSTGLLKTEGAWTSAPDPGFTPEEWAKLKNARFSGAFRVGKDSACPIWIDYAKASARQQLDAGIDGVWADNYSPWDSLGATPIAKGFGEWSVVGFREYLRAHFTADQLRAMGVADPARFDIRVYLRTVCQSFGGDPANLKDAKWRDARWSSDPVWRAYLIYKRQTGTKALSAYYRAIKTEAAAAGRPDFLVAGNDIPVFSLGWVRGDLDLVSTELSPGWGLTSGPQGFMWPPLGSYVPVYQLAREHAQSRRMNAWLYAPPADTGKPNLANVLYSQALAFDASAMPHYSAGSRTVGTRERDAAFFAFAETTAPFFKDREPVEEVGLYYSSSSQIMELLPGGFRDHSDQPHSFSFYGWGAALTFLHVPWKAVPEWKLDALSKLRVLIIPSTAVFPPEDIPILRQWMEAGGSLVIAGECGSRLGEAGNFDAVPSGSTLQPLFTESASAGRGQLVKLKIDPGIAFYKAARQRPQQLPEFADAIKAALGGTPALTLDASEVSSKTEISLHRAGGTLFVDLVNTDIDVATDTVTPTQPTTFRVAIPKDWDERHLKITVLSPDEAPKVTSRALAGHRLEITLGSFAFYASAVVASED